MSKGVSCASGTAKTELGRREKIVRFKIPH